MDRYHKFEQEVFDWLLEKNRKDPSFRFSLRQQASKGAEADYLIGKKKSKYFGTTLWQIPVSYPGSSTDLINLMWKETDQGLIYYAQFTQTRKKLDGQNTLALEFLRYLKPSLKKGFPAFRENDPKNAVEFYYIPPRKSSYPSFDDMRSDVEEDLNMLIPLVDQALSDFQKLNPVFKGHRLNQEEFKSMMDKMKIRREKHLQAAFSSPTIIVPTLEEHKSINPRLPKEWKHNGPLNQILYGPPGTGKTYNTINKALEILDVEIIGMNRSTIKTEFEKYVALEQILFTTFHQSMSYEDFIEGIKPQKPLTTDPFLKYDIEPGLFRKISETARSNYEASRTATNGNISFETAFEKLVDEWEANPGLKFPLKTPGYDYTIIGFTKTSVQFRKASGGTSHTLSIATLREQFYGKEYQFSQGVGIYYPSILAKLKSYKGDSTTSIEENRYVLIIDEINRGNVSQIFGELITLIEDDKRIGKPEELQVNLPYSKEKFGVPPNLYIIGTMNTADRSVEALDAALRRRFSFEEMPPRPELLCPHRMIWELFWKYKNYSWKQAPYQILEQSMFQLFGIEENFKLKDEIWARMEAEGKNEAQIAYLKSMPANGINLKNLLKTINERIEKLLDKDHKIGHSYFMKVESLEDLREAFRSKIIPLLQEYFFGDIGKIRLVLGDGFFVNLPEEGETTIFAPTKIDSLHDFGAREVHQFIDLSMDKGNILAFRRAIKGIWSDISKEPVTATDGPST